MRQDLGIKTIMSGEIEPYRRPEPTEHTARDFELSDGAKRLVLEGLNENTYRAYQKQWAPFVDWCQRDGRVALPATAATLTEYITHLIQNGGPHSTTLSPASISQAISAIRHVHTGYGYPEQPPITAALSALKAYRKQCAANGKRPRKAMPILLDALQDMVATCDPNTTVGIRDRAVLVISWGLMSRRSEVAALWDHDVRETPDGLEVYIAISKTDKDAKGEEVAIPKSEPPEGKQSDTDPVLAVRAWRDTLAAHGITGGKLFRSIDRHGNIRDSIGPDGVNRIVKKATEAAGLHRSDQYSAHGLRAGGATQAYKNGALLGSITRQGRWSERSATVLGYIRGVDKWADNPMKGML